MRSMIILTLICVLFAAPAWLEAQAMVGYGILVAGAGAAGVGTGAGVGGILSALKGTTDSAGNSGGTVTVSSRRTPELEEDDLAPKTIIKLPKRDQAKLSTGSSRRTIKGGVVISGVPASNARAKTGTTVRVRGATGSQSGGDAEKPIQWDVGNSGSGPRSSPVRGASRAAPQPVRQPAKEKEAKADDTTATAASNSPAEPAAQETVESETASDTAAAHSPGTTPLTGPTRIFAAPWKVGAIAPTPAEATQALDETADDDIEIELGEDVAAVIERFGKPSMVLKGISGQDYTEKYTFRTKEGRKIVVLALNGKVTAINPEPLLLAARR